MKLSVTHHRTAAGANLARVKRLTRWLLRQALGPHPRPWKEASLVLTDDAGITPVNRAHFGKDRPTDVISFRYEPLPGEPPGLSGEVIVNAQRARQVGRTPENASRELALYIAHGCLHLTGASDRTAALRARMRRQETAWLAQAERRGLIRGLCGLGARGRMRYRVKLSKS